MVKIDLEWSFWGLEMRKSSLILCAGLLVLWVGGCASQEEATTPTESPSPSVAAQSPTATQSFAKPLVSEKNGNQKVAVTKNRVPGLVQATDPEERARQVQAGINVKKSQTDPFASLPPLVTFRTPAGNAGIPTPAAGTTAGGAGGTQTARLPQIPSFPQPPQQASSSPRRAAQSPQRGGSNPGSAAGAPIAPLKPTPPAIAALPPLPEPTLAKAVEVSGVIVVGGVAEAIVKAPNESTSRYVRAGQRLSNGQVLVKRIEVNAGSDPLVILEQNGVEVSRGVGEKSVPAGSPTASMPIPSQGAG
ncbi:MAG: hypothetical protein HC780_01930 [Leptolyngbyaceae cyanobacterium CSU_1_3]|nr:hypothetical protein [Leptolyngbyaceae cyanobacterium CSU_1_3]